MLSKEYFTYYIILGILLGSIIILLLDPLTRTAPTRRFRSGVGEGRPAGEGKGGRALWSQTVLDCASRPRVC